jgi:transcriptional regulator with XRE-family HTH domain
MNISKAYQEISEKLKTANLMEVSRKTGVAYNTLLAIKAGTANPTIATLEAVAAALEA